MPTLKALGEFGLIERARQWLPRPAGGWKVGIGDDAAVFKLSSRHYQLFTEDLLVEGVHFRRGSPRDWQDLGWKSLAVNLSDIAAMGGKPLGAVLGLALPKKTKFAEIEAFYRGLAEASRLFACPIVGGDTNASLSGVSIAVALIGETRKSPLLRRGAKAGEGLWVTGELGSAALGWTARRRRIGGASAAFQRRHARPTPRLEWGQALAASGMVSSAMDLSDGLAGDLPHLAQASKVGFVVDIDLLPRSKAFLSLCKKLKVSEEKLAVSGGEDYELLFTVAGSRENRFREYCRRQRIAVTRIGEATSKRGLEWRRAGKKIKTVWQGYRHF
jgi:thiamine-monophosphate kinase